MANLNKQLKALFHKYLDRLEDEKSRPSYSNGVTHIPSTRPMPPCYRQGDLFNNSEDTDGFKGCIYFYEWSNASATPRAFYTLKKFDEFLQESKIYLASWQREVLRNMHNPYVSCRKGTKDLIIKSTYDAMRRELLDNPLAYTPPLSMAMGSEDCEPYNVMITRPPSARHETLPQFEPEGRWSESCQGEHWYG